MGRLFWKFFFFILLAQILIAVSIGTTFWIKGHGLNKSNTFIDQSPPGAFMISAAASTLQFGGKSALQNLIKNSMGHHQIIAVDEDGHEILNRTVDEKMIQSAKQIALANDDGAGAREVIAPGGQRFLLFLTSGNRPPQEPPIHLLGGHSPYLLGTPFMHAIPEIATLLASLLFSTFLAWYFSKPIRTLRTAFHAAGKGNLEFKIGPIMGQRRDELGDLGLAFDMMTTQLRASIEGQRRLLHDVSHELRSPLARIQAAIGLVRQQPENVASSIERIERESVRMDKLIGELLTLSRLEVGVKISAEEDIHMDDLLLAMIEDAQFEAANKECKVKLIGNSHVIIDGQHEMLYRAIENVVRNAIKHTANGSDVVIESTVDSLNRKLNTTIFDCGPGVEEKELNAIFEPFYRVEDFAHNADGHGLGLAIAQRVIQAHHGTITASNRVGGGLQVKIVLPIKQIL